MRNRLQQAAATIASKRGGRRCLAIYRPLYSIKRHNEKVKQDQLDAAHDRQIFEEAMRDS